MELTFLGPGVQAILQQSTQSPPHLLNVFLFGPRKNENVIQVDKEVFVKHVSDIIDKGLEHCRGIGKHVRHDPIFEVSKRGFKCCLPFIPFLDKHQMVRVPEV